MRPSSAKFRRVSTASRYLLTYRYEEGERYSYPVEIVSNPDGGFSELIIKDAFSAPLKLTRHDLSVIAELLRQGLISGKEVGLRPLEEG